MDTCQPDQSRAYTKGYQIHQPSGFCYRTKYTHDDYNDSVVDCEKDVAKTFVGSKKKEIDEITKIYETKIAMVMTEKDKDNFAESTLCHICDNILGFNKIRDQNHLTGTYRGKAYSECNLAFTLPKFVPIVFHNLSR